VSLVLEENVSLFLEKVSKEYYGGEMNENHLFSSFPSSGSVILKNLKFQE
jgi:hypothetical protein